MSILITGSSGYIGSILAAQLAINSYSVVGIDKAINADFNLDTIDPRKLAAYMDSTNVVAVCHLAALASVPDSIKDPIGYYTTNVVGTINLIKAMKLSGVNRLIFSSTAAVYGSDLPVYSENDITNPTTPYGKSKLMAEKIIEDSGIKSTIFRYFNVAGAHLGLGENRKVETHLIPCILMAAKNDTSFNIYGSNLDTHDGTCIRDYVHVADIVDAHIKALAYSHSGSMIDTFNIGSGTGYSIKQVLDSCEKAVGKKIKYELHEEKRGGDPDVLIADTNRFKHAFKWKPRYSLDDITRTAWEWFNANTI